MKSTKEMIEVMQAFERGEKIQTHYKLKDLEYWEDTENPEWDWHFYDYRVKPKVKESKFKEGDIIVYINKNSKSYGSIFKVISCDIDYIHCDFVKLINFNIEKGTGSYVFYEKELEHFENALNNRFLWFWILLNNEINQIEKSNIALNLSNAKKYFKENLKIKPIFELGFIDTQDEDVLKDFIEVSQNEDIGYDDNLPFN